MYKFLKASSMHAAKQAARDSKRTSAVANDATPTGDDLISLPPFMDMMDDPSLLQAIMEQQGVTGIDHIEPTGPLGGGTADNNYKGYIHWTDGTQTKVQMKGSRSTDKAPTSYREALFYSRMADTLPGVNVPSHYTAVADMETDQGLQVTEFMVGYTTLQDINNAYNGGVLADYGLEDFDWTQTNMDVMDLLGHFAAAHWMDASQEDQFYLKGYNWLSGEKDQNWIDNAHFV